MRVRPASAWDQVPGQRDGAGVRNRTARRLGEVRRRLQAGQLRRTRSAYRRAPPRACRARSVTRNGSSVRTEERFDQGGGESNLKFLETKGFKLVEGTTLA